MLMEQKHSILNWIAELKQFEGWLIHRCLLLGGKHGFNVNYEQSDPVENVPSHSRCVGIDDLEDPFLPKPF